MPKFDVVVGNPPFQDSSKIAKNSNLWTKFVVLGMNNLLKNDGFLLLITPSSWMSPNATQNNKLKDVFTKFNLIYLNINIKHFFNVGSTFCYYLIQKNNNYIQTKIQTKNELFKCNLLLPFLPNELSSISLSIINKVLLNSNEKLNFDSGSRIDGHFLESGKYKIYYSNKIVYYNEHAKNHFISKIVVNKPGYLNPRYDNGNISTCGMNYWMPIDELNSINCIKYLNSILIQSITQKICKYSGYNNLGILKLIPKLDFSQEWTDEKLYKYFNLTQEEIYYIESQVK